MLIAYISGISLFPSYFNEHTPRAGHKDFNGIQMYAQSIRLIQQHRVVIWLLLRGTLHARRAPWGQASSDAWGV